MTVNEKNFVITLNEEEITLLHKAANEMKKKYAPLLDSEDVDERIKGNKYVSEYRRIRNALASLVNVSYMGDDI